MKKNKFSIIIPVYNTSKYLEKCLYSVENQTYDKYEIIVVNDGSTDSSEEIIKKQKNITYIKQKNKGLSSARNVGIAKATGDYLVFLDSDDWIEPNFLEILNSTIKGEDIIRFQPIIDINNVQNKKPERSFNLLTGGEAFSIISKYKYVENATLYIYNKDYWNSNKFKFKEGFYHEDFGLIPEVIIKASKVTSIKEYIYHYVQNEGSIMHTADEEKIEKKAYDTLYQGIEEINNIREIGVDDSYKRVFNSFIVNSILLKLRDLSFKNNKEFVFALKSNNLIDYLLDDTLKRKIKKLIYKIKYKL